jgi:hypothetical protein
MDTSTLACIVISAPLYTQALSFEAGQHSTIHPWRIGECTDSICDVTSGNSLFDELVLLRSFQRDGVHAVTSANIPGVKPIHFQTARRSVFPTEEVGVCYPSGISVSRMSDPCKE